MKSFEELGLNEDLLKAIRELGYEQPTPIQEQTIEVLLSGRDVIAQAQTGTGKTAAFALPILQRLDMANRSPQALIMAPTRELAVQVAEMVHALGRFNRAHVLAIYGGQPIDRQLKGLKYGAQIVVGTPGRLLDHLRRESLDLSGIKTVVLDEGDQMLDMGFIDEIADILEQCPKERQTALFSATVPAPIAGLARKYLKDPAEVKIASDAMTTPAIDQVAYEVQQRGKREALTRILDHDRPDSAIVFCRTKRDCDTLGEELELQGYQAESLHGDLTQAQRDRVMRRFREGQIDCLVATDVAARGLDIEAVSHVINYDIPGDPESYVHRIGRTGRAGREGVAITLVTPRERNYLRTIERLTRQKIRIERLPSMSEVATKRMKTLRDRLAASIEAGGLEPYLLVAEELGDLYDPIEVTAAAIRALAEAEGIKPADDVASEEGVDAEPGMARLFIPIGRNVGLHPRDLVGAIANETDLPGRAIGAIDIYASSSFVDVPDHAVETVIRALNHTTLRGHRVRVERAKPFDGTERPREAPFEASAREEKKRHGKPDKKKDGARKK